eukprot:CAMPEP_0179437308 /NCGR_PEP_ID=MMETSP0799-20121207/21226_1 /TAXON_ID=46947 /ORGANISM="Geminigera cryophila, Strain CCMP2564" /LENGTH=105 /DNA_ID=CAMNT_0021218165 /DNA_START=26 /DNA_END=343 /DNA_ORIENTATION=-
MADACTVKATCSNEPPPPRVAPTAAINAAPLTGQQEQCGARRNSMDPVDEAEFDGFYGVTDRRKKEQTEGAKQASISRRGSSSCVVVEGHEWDSFFGGKANTKFD